MTMRCTLRLIRTVDYWKTRQQGELEEDLHPSTASSSISGENEC